MVLQQIITKRNEEGIKVENLESMWSYLKTFEQYKVDWLANGKAMKYIAGELVIEHPEGMLMLSPSSQFENQICAALGIPKKWYNKLKADGHLDNLDSDVNLYLQHQGNKLIRMYVNQSTGTGEARAFLSDSYRPIDNMQMLETVYRTLMAHKESIPTYKVKDFQATADRFLMRIYFPEATVMAKELIGKYRRPDGQVPDNIDQFPRFYTGITVSNSETGAGRFLIEPMAVTAACTNRTMFAEEGISQVHVGAKLDPTINWQRDTVKKAQEVVMLQTRDALTHYLAPEWLEEKVHGWIEENTELQRPIKVAQRIGEEFDLGESLIEQLVTATARGGLDTTHGIREALTWVASRDVSNTKADETLRLERLAGKLTDKQIARFDIEASMN